MAYQRTTQGPAAYCYDVAAQRALQKEAKEREAMEREAMEKEAKNKEAEEKKAKENEARQKMVEEKKLQEKRSMDANAMDKKLLLNERNLLLIEKNLLLNEKKLLLNEKQLMEMKLKTSPEKSGVSIQTQISSSTACLTVFRRHPLSESPWTMKTRWTMTKLKVGRNRRPTHFSKGMAADDLRV